MIYGLQIPATRLSSPSRFGGSYRGKAMYECDHTRAFIHSARKMFLSGFNFGHSTVHLLLVASPVGKQVDNCGSINGTGLSWFT